MNEKRDVTRPPLTQAPGRTSGLARLLCTLAAAFLAGLGLLAIVTQTHSGYARHKGYVTLQGDPAVSMGFVLICMALLPLVVWVPKRWVGWTLAGWVTLLMGTIFLGVFKPF